MINLMINLMINIMINLMINHNPQSLDHQTIITSQGRIFEWCCAQVNTDVLDTVLLSLHPAEVPADI